MEHENEWELLLFVKNLIFNLNKENIEQSAKSIVDKFSNTYPFSFNLLIVRITHAALVLREKEIDLYLNFLKEIQKLEMSFLKEIDIFDIYIYAHFYDNENRQEFHYMITKMIESKLIDKKILDNICTRDINFHGGYFLQYMTNEKIKDLEYYESVKFITDNYEELSKNDFELHKKLIEDGHNPNEITKIIRNDEIEKLQEISSQEDFDFDQTIEPSPYERCSFVNNYASLINYAAFFGSVKCFKYLLMNGANLSNTGQYAVAGGNEEIIHLCEQNHSSFQNAYETAIKFQRNDIFKYIYEKKLEKFGENNVIQYIVGANKKNILEELGKNCVSYFNFEIFSFLQKEGMKINDDIINVSADFGNIFLVKHFLQHNQIPKDILVFSARSGNFELVKYILEHESININVKDYLGRTGLIWASLKGYTEIVKLLLEQKGIDINAKDNYGQTALINASLNGHTEIVKLLLEQEGIDINAKDNYGNTALINASLNGHTEIVKLLLEQEGIDMDAQNNYGQTALMYASDNGYTEIVKLLLEQEGIDKSSLIK